jgi:hypothetical protein
MCRHVSPRDTYQNSQSHTRQHCDYRNGQTKHPPTHDTCPNELSQTAECSLIINLSQNARLSLKFNIVIAATKEIWDDIGR